MKPIFSIKPMSPYDFAFAASLTDLMRWNLVEDDFAYMVTLEPHGCFVLFSNSKRAGIITTIIYDHVGWIGNVIVDSKYRNQGAGSFLVQHAINYLEKNKVTTIGLYAYLAKKSFYNRLGFINDANYVVLHGSPKSVPDFKSNITIAIEKHHQAIIEFDHHCLGFSRQKLLRSLLQSSSTRCYVAIRHNRIIGYVITKDYNGVAELGPLVCERQPNELSLHLLYSILQDHLKSDTFMCIPQNECALIESLKKLSFEEDFRVIRMIRGLPLSNNCIQIAESLERG